MPAPIDTYGNFYIHASKKGGDGPDEWEDVTMVEVFIKGNPNASISKRVYDADGDPVKDREGRTFMELYPKAWAHFNREEYSEEGGTPLKDIAGVGPSQILNLSAQGIETAEDLAELPDNVVIGESGMLDLRNRAQAYLASRYPEKQKAIDDAKEAELEELKAKVAQMEAMMNQPKKRGRPRKEAA